VSYFRTALWLAGALLACALISAPMCASASAHKVAHFANRPSPKISGTDVQEQPEEQPTPQPVDFVDTQGPFSIGDQPYTVVLHEKVLGKSGNPPPNQNTFLSTLAELDVVDANGQALFQETFPFALANGRFSQTLNASASLLSSQGGMALVIQFIEQSQSIEQSANTGAGGSPVRESWQIFGLSNGRLTKFGPVLPLGQSSDIAVGGVVTAVMAKGGIVLLPLASAAEELQVRAWTGNFYVLVPMRVDWMHAQWGEAETCYELAEGTLKERGCTLSVEAPRQPASAASDVYVPLFSSVNDQEAMEVPLTANSTIDFLDVLATVHWKDTAGRSECSFDNLWLHTRIDGKEGWVHGQESLAALGLPQSLPR
jgi:hypothetical protein